MSMSSVRGAKRRGSGRRAPSASPRQLDRGGADQSLQRRRELAHADADFLGRELSQQGLGDLAGQPLDEVHAALRADLDDAARHLAVVHRAREVVRDGGAGEVQRELRVHREPDAHRLLGGGHAVMAVEADVLEAQAIGGHSFTTGFLREPTPSTRTSTRSPGSSRSAPAGVPVAITSPGTSVMISDTRATRPSTLSALGSRSVAMHGPSGQNVSKPLARVGRPEYSSTTGPSSAP